MATVFVRSEAAQKGRDRKIGVRRPGGSAELPLFHFGLRQLLVFVAVTCVFLAAIASSHGGWTLVLLVAAAVVTMHVFATALGTRLRSRTDQQATSRPEVVASGSRRSRRLAAIRTSRRSPWHDHRSTSLPWLPRFVLSATILGAAAGSLFLAMTIGHRASPAGIVVGAASFGVLAGWFAFLCGNFYGVFRHGVREALAEQRKDESLHPAGSPRRKPVRTSRRLTHGCE